MTTEPVMSRDAVAAYLDEVFPQIHHGGPGPVVAAVGPMSAVLRLPYHDRHVRPGGTLSGPAMMMLADVAFYVALLVQLGPVPLAVTTSLSFNFLRKPARRDLLGEARIMKLGRRLAVGEVLIRSDGSDDLVCHATGTYAIPAPEKNAVS
ncbi:PaaI family thioesterase [Methylobacterium oryzihabitans]|uniref:PaaI family thioesterase n=1 Tax=Methylobacterium oryzihabitans TaxID=2499852 RepID=A0A437NWX9_9HYPH|nr:PaaI family thioesterase [Methylobacterium oryzihabitans]RVU14441.1 PaaI family thioesterase [Methylobacterium oryzihabitans]